MPCAVLVRGTGRSFPSQILLLGLPLHQRRVDWEPYPTAELLLGIIHILPCYGGFFCFISPQRPSRYSSSVASLTYQNLQPAVWLRDGVIVLLHAGAAQGSLHSQGSSSHWFGVYGEARKKVISQTLGHFSTPR